MLGFVAPNALGRRQVDQARLHPLPECPLPAPLHPMHSGNIRVPGQRSCDLRPVFRWQRLSWHFGPGTPVVVERLRPIRWARLPADQSAQRRRGPPAGYGSRRPELVMLSERRCGRTRRKLRCTVQPAPRRKKPTSSPYRSGTSWRACSHKCPVPHFDWTRPPIQMPECRTVTPLK